MKADDSKTENASTSTITLDVECPNCRKMYRSVAAPLGTKLKCKSCSCEFVASVYENQDFEKSHPLTEKTVKTESFKQVPQAEDPKLSKSQSAASDRSEVFVIRRKTACLIGSGVLGGILLSAIAVSLLMALRSAPKTETKPKAQQSVYEMIKAKQANSDKEKEEAVSLEVEGRRKSQSQKTRNNSDAIANAFWENAMRRAEQQKQKNAEWSRFMNNLNRCKPCNGSGSYSYVDQFGNLKARTCPYCNGLGNNALIQNQLRR